jgi:ATP-dependent DNA helicase RecG
LWTLRQALSFLHHPTPDASLETLQDHSHPAWQRLKAEELLAQQLSQLQSRREPAHMSLRAPVLAMVAPDVLQPAQRRARAARTAAAVYRVDCHTAVQTHAAQQRVCAEIASDLARPVPMHRLLQGDVGSGKTVVAALAATICIDAGWQCALMAPNGNSGRATLSQAAWLAGAAGHHDRLADREPKGERAPRGIG